MFGGTPRGLRWVYRLRRPDQPCAVLFSRILSASTRCTTTGTEFGNCYRTLRPKCPVRNTLLELTVNSYGDSRTSDRPPRRPHQGDAATRLEFADPEKGL